MLVTVGADIGVRAEKRALSAEVTLGPTLAYFMASRQAETICELSCVAVRRGYQAGPRLAATGALAVGYRLNRQLRLFYEARGHLPFRLGQAGFTGDSSAGFVEIAMGVTLTRLAGPPY